MRTVRGPGGRDHIRPGLERIQEALERTGHPERAFRTIHIAGTNGKGSTARFCEEILRRLLPGPVGLYTSPHLLSPTERIRVSGKEIPAGRLDEALEKSSAVSREVEAATGEPLSWFEEMTWVACDWFRTAGVPLAILETGLGGSWDATSACLPEVSVITTVGIDHREWLGGTIPRIAAEKSGILRKGVPAVIGLLRPSARRVVLGKARETGSPVWEMGRDIFWEESSRGRITVRLPGGVSVRGAKPGMEGTFQRGNAALACAAAWRAAAVRGVTVRRFERAAREGLEAARFPGRFSPIPGKENRGVLVDGAHNPDAAAALARELGPRGSNPRTIALWSMLQEKDAGGFVRALTHAIDGWVAYPMEQERAASLADLAEVLRASRVEWMGSMGFREGWNIARSWAGRSGRVIVCGSLMAVGDAYRHRVGRLQ